MLIQQKPDPINQLATPSIPLASHEINGANHGSLSPPTRSAGTVRVVNGEIVGLDQLAIGSNTSDMAIPTDLHGADVSTGRPRETGASGAETGALATAGESAGTNYGPNLGFPFPNSELLAPSCQWQY